MGNVQSMLPTQRSRSNWIKFKKGDQKKLKFENKRKSETLTIDDIMLNCETTDFSKSSYTNREIDKSNTLLLVFCSLSLEGTKEGEVIQLDYQHVYVWDLEKLFVLHVLRLCIFQAGQLRLHSQT